MKGVDPLLLVNAAHPMPEGAKPDLTAVDERWPQVLLERQGGPGRGGAPSRRNEKDHFVDCSELVPTVDEFLALPFIHGKTIKDVFDHATFYASISGEKD